MSDGPVRLVYLCLEVAGCPTLLAGLANPVNRPQWTDLETRTEAAWVRRALAGNWPPIPDPAPGELALVCRPNLDVCSGLAGLYRTRHGNLPTAWPRCSAAPSRTGVNATTRCGSGPGRCPRRTSWPPGTAMPPGSGCTWARSRRGTCGSTARAGPGAAEAGAAIPWSPAGLY